MLPSLWPTKHQATVQQTVTTKSSKVSSAPPKTASAPTVPKPPVSTPKKTYKKTTTPKPAPVVVPSPASNVSSLKPEPVAPSSGSGPAPSAPTSTVSYTSTNWAGYLAASATYTRVSASWIVPTATGNGSTTSADATWVGIGGVSSGDLIQVGTSNIVSASGQVTTSAFYELLPSFSQTITSLPISSGDSISASVTETSAGQWLIAITDNTTGQSYTHAVAYASTHSSAEWIEEDPSYSHNQLIPLDNFGTATFTSASATANGVAGNMLANTSQMVTLVNSSGQELATTSAISGSGAGFSVSHN
jgi:hypothetical protein